jgi:AcrR family transcriptional regulator
MSKGEQTREMILQQAARLFNRKGYFGSALSDLMQETGLEKGGIYNHFKSKEDLALQAFDYAVDLVRQEIWAAAKGQPNMVDRLLAVITVFQREAEGYPVAGGCPVLNTAIEADDAHSALRDRARQAMDEWYDFIRRTVKKGIARGEIKAEVDPDSLVTFYIATLEGGIMLSKLYNDIAHMNRAVATLTRYLELEVRA